MATAVTYRVFYGMHTWWFVVRPLMAFSEYGGPTQQDAECAAFNYCIAECMKGVI